MSSTRIRILDAAREITEKHGAAPSMAALARAVGISRQALYLHFPDRARLLVAVMAHAGEQEQIEAGTAAVRQAPDGAAAIRAWAQLQARHRPKLAPAARALAGTRHADPAASAAWADRADHRMLTATAIVERLREEGRLDPAWTTTEAAALLWELNSFHVWDDLVNGAHIAPNRYVEIITAAALSALSAPIRQPASRTNTQEQPTTLRHPHTQSSGYRRTGRSARARTAQTAAHLERGIGDRAPRRGSALVALGYRFAGRYRWVSSGPVG